MFVSELCDTCEIKGSGIQIKQTGKSEKKSLCSHGHHAGKSCNRHCWRLATRECKWTRVYSWRKAG